MPSRSICEITGIGNHDYSFVIKGPDVMKKRLGRSKFQILKLFMTKRNTATVDTGYYIFRFISRLTCTGMAEQTKHILSGESWTESCSFQIKK